MRVPSMEPVIALLLGLAFASTAYAASIKEVPLITEKPFENCAWDSPVKVTGGWCLGVVKNCRDSGGIVQPPTIAHCTPVNDNDCPDTNHASDCLNEQRRETQAASPSNSVVVKNVTIMNVEMCVFYNLVSHQPQPDSKISIMLNSCLPAGNRANFTTVYHPDDVGNKDAKAP
jgi:hypothetical protein